MGGGSQGRELNLEREVEGVNPGETQAAWGSASGSSRSSSAGEACPAATGEGTTPRSGKGEAELLQAAVGGLLWEAGGPCPSTGWEQGHPSPRMELSL